MIARIVPRRFVAFIGRREPLAASQGVKVRMNERPFRSPGDRPAWIASRNATWRSIWSWPSKPSQISEPPIRVPSPTARDESPPRRNGTTELFSASFASAITASTPIETKLTAPDDMRRAFSFRKSPLSVRSSLRSLRKRRNATNDRNRWLFRQGATSRRPVRRQRPLGEIPGGRPENPPPAPVRLRNGPGGEAGAVSSARQSQFSVTRSRPGRPWNWFGKVPPVWRCWS